MFRSTVLILLPLIAAATATAQDYLWRDVNNVGIKCQVYKKLAAVPLQLGTSGPHLRARFEPENEGDYIYGREGKYAWQLYVYEFEKQVSKPTTGKDKPDKPMSREEAEARAREEFMARRKARDFEHWVTEKDPNTSAREVKVKAKPVKGSKKRPAHELWEYYDVTTANSGNPLTWYKIAASYDLGDRHVALVTVIPCKKGNKPDNKYAKIAKKMVQSLRIIEVDGNDTDAKRDQFANTPERKEALAKLKENLAGLDNWDYFTTPFYIFAYSWEKPAKKNDRKKFAREMADKIEHIREQFMSHYPPHDKMTKAYSVVRICSDYDEFTKYGNTQRGVIGWFSPMSKELVIFNDTKNELGQIDVLSVCYHEGWHQYSDAYWPGTELHRWFDEGLAEYFGAMRKVGKRWKREYHRNRLQSIKGQLSTKNYIPSADIVTWHKDKFYGPRASDHYAQAWAMVDFLQRGKKKLKRKWDDSWDQIMATYSQVQLEKRSDKKAVEAAFAGIDMEKFEEAWMEWVDGGAIKK